jgi:hypothetical protein
MDTSARYWADYLLKRWAGSGREFMASEFADELRHLCGGRITFYECYDFLEAAARAGRVYQGSSGGGAWLYRARGAHNGR